MGKNSWLTAVKRAFRSPTKDSDKKSSRRKVDHQQAEEERKTERRGWLFKKHSNSIHNPHPSEQQMEGVEPTEQRQAIAVATAAAEAAVATAKAAIEIIRLTQPSLGPNLHSAARVIQTAFRGYLARRALVALKGIVKLQALIRGQNVRKQTTLTMRCMQTLLRVQTRMRAGLSHQGGRRSMFAETSNLWESNYIGDIRDRKSRSRDGSCVSDDCPRTLQELEAILKARNEASLAFAFSRQNKIVDSDDNRANWLDQWMSSRQQQWESKSRPSTDYRRADTTIKTIDIDSLRTSSAGGRKSRCQSPVPQFPRQRSQSPCHVSRPTKSPQIRPSSPRCLKEENYQSAANTPSVRSTPSVNSTVSVPNYMAATESAKARIRWQSAPRQRPATPERERSGYGSARKRLSYPVPEPHCVNLGFGNLRSPSFKSVQAGYVGMEEQSCYAESVAGEISPCSTTELRRWMR